MGHRPQIFDFTDELAAAFSTGLSAAAREYLKGDGRTDAADYLFYRLIGWPQRQATGAQTICTAADLRACRQVLSAPEFAGRLPEVVSFGWTWEAIVLRWPELCALQDREDGGAAGRGATDASIAATVLEAMERQSARYGEQRADHELLGRVHQAYPQCAGSGWRVGMVCEQGLGLTPPGPPGGRSGQGERPVVAQLPEGHVAVGLVRFGEPMLIAIVSA